MNTTTTNNTNTLIDYVLSVLDGHDNTTCILNATTYINSEYEDIINSDDCTDEEIDEIKQAYAVLTKEDIARVQNKLNELNLIYNEDAKVSYKLCFNRSKDYNFTVSIKENITDKKVGYAGGCGYDKTAGAFSDFISNYLLKDTPFDVKSKIITRVDSGAFTGCYSGLNIPNAVEFFKGLGFDFAIEEDKSKEFKIGKKYEFKLRRVN